MLELIVASLHYRPVAIMPPAFLIMRNRKEEHRKAYANPHVKEYHRKWIRNYWQKIKADPILMARRKAMAKPVREKSEKKRLMSLHNQWLEMMAVPQSRMAMFLLLLEMSKRKRKPFEMMSHLIEKDPKTLTSEERQERTLAIQIKYRRNERSTPEGLARQKEIRLKHLPKSRKTRTERQRHKLIVDRPFRALHAMRGRLNRLLKNVGAKKQGRTFEYFGCKSLDEFKNIIEAKFKPGMTWQNFGLSGWVIDHIRPCASFDLRNTEEQRACFHHSNLQPEWNMDNVFKSSRWNGKIWKKSDHQKEESTHA